VVDRVDRHAERSHQPHQFLADTAGADDEDARAEQSHAVDGRPVGRLAEHVQAACEGEHQCERVLGAGRGIGPTGARVGHAVAQDARREPAFDAGGRELDPADAGVVELAQRVRTAGHHQRIGVGCGVDDGPAGSGDQTVELVVTPRADEDTGRLSSRRRHVPDPRRRTDA